MGLDDLGFLVSIPTARMVSFPDDSRTQKMWWTHLSVLPKKAKANVPEDIGFFLAYLIVNPLNWAICSSWPGNLSLTTARYCPLTSASLLPCSWLAAAAFS